MATINTSIGIAEEKLVTIIKHLDELLGLAFVDDKGEAMPLVSGYNLYPQAVQFDRAIALSNMHKTERYKKSMIDDILKRGYGINFVANNIRNKQASYLWQVTFHLRSENGDLHKGLRIKDKRTGKYLDLKKYGLTLEESGEFSDAGGCLIADDCDGWELNLPFNSKEELEQLVGLFTQKMAVNVYDNNGIKIGKNPDHWEDAFDTPVLILGEKAINYAMDTKYFDKAMRIVLEENDSEVSFIVHNSYPILKTVDQYRQLLQLGFKPELCLANKAFLRFVDSR